MHQLPTDRPDLTVQQVADAMALSIDTVMRLIRAGELEAYSVSVSPNPTRTSYRIPAAEVDRFRESRRVVRRAPEPKPMKRPTRRFV